MNYPNKILVEYEGDIVINDVFDDYLDTPEYTIIDHERFGRAIADDIVSRCEKSVSIDDIYIAIENCLVDMKQTVEYYAEEYLINNTDIEVRE